VRNPQHNFSRTIHRDSFVGLDLRCATAVQKAGLSVDALRQMSDSDLQLIPGIATKRARQVRAWLNRLSQELVAAHEMA